MTVQASRDTLKIVSVDVDFSNPVSFNQYVESPTHLRVYADTALLVEGVHFGVSATPSDGVTVTFTEAALLLDPVVFAIEHVPPLDQDADLSAGGIFGAVYEDAIDAIMRRVQSLGKRLERAYKAPVDDGRVEPLIIPGADGEVAVFSSGSLVGGGVFADGSGGGDDAVVTERIADKVTASAADIPANVFWVETNAYDASIHPTKGAARYRVSSLLEVTGVSSRFWFEVEGVSPRYFIIDTVNQKITLTMAGGWGDLTYELQSGLNSGGGNGNGTVSTEGFIRTGGTDDRTAMLALDAFAADNGIIAYIDADHYISHQAKLTARWMGIDGPYKFVNTLWLEYFSPYDGTLATITDEIENGIWFENPNDYAGLLDLKIIGQFNVASGGKPSVCVPDMPILGPGGGLGDRGSIISIGTQYHLTPATQPIRHCDLRVLVMRAGRKTATNHFSQGNLMIAIQGYVEHCKFEIGLFGKTNTTSNSLCVLFWSGYYDQTINGFAPYADVIPNKTQSTLIEQYFPSFNEISYITDIDNTTTLANISKALELNGVGPTKVNGYYTKGVPVPFAITCGDYTDRFVCEKQKGLPGRGIRVGFIKGDLCYQKASASEFRKGGFLVKGSGTASGRANLYDDTQSYGTPDVRTLNPDDPQLNWVNNLGIQKLTLQEYSVVCDGFDLEIINSTGDPNTDPAAVVGMTIANGMGYFNLGRVHLRGDCQRGIEIEHFNGDIVVEGYTGVGTLSHEFSKGGRFYRINNDKGTDVEIAFTSGGTHVAAVGETITGLTSAATGTVKLVRVTSGSFAAGTAAGYLYVETASGTWAAENATLTGGGNDMTISAVSTGVYKPGFGNSANPTENACVQIVGTTFVVGTTAANVNIGDTKIPLTAVVPTIVYERDPIQIGTTWTRATETIVDPQSLNVKDAGGVDVLVDFGGVSYITVEPMTAAVLAGATVTCDQRGYVEEFQGGFRNSQYGMMVNNSYVKNCDLSELQSSSQYGVRMSNNSNLEMVGRMPVTVGGSGLTSSTVRIEGAGSLLACRNMIIYDNPNLTHIQLPNPSGRAVFEGCQVETISRLHPSTEGNTAWDKVRMIGGYDFSGNPLRNGPYTVTPTVRTGGSATGIPISVNASRVTEDASSNVDLTLEITLGTLAAPTAGTLTIVNSTSDTADWPAPNAAQTGVVDVIANGAGLPASVYCEIATDKTITLYSQGATGRTALTDANIATGMQFRARLRYTRAAS